MAARLRKAIGLTEFAEVLGFNWTDDSDWVWNDVSNLVADLIEPSCDREELLAVAETLEDCAGRGSDLTALGYSRLAKRIREALGVTGNANA